MFPMPPQAKYVFPSAYGGAVASEDPPQIHDFLRKLRIEIGAVEAVKSTDKYGPKFPVRGAKDLAQKLANALNTLNMEAPVVHQEITILDTDKIPANERQSGNPVFRTLTHVKSVVRLIAPDTSFIDVVGSGHGGDVDDKAGGKASTYAWKDAILKGLSIPHEDMVDTDDDSSAGKEEPSRLRTATRKGSAQSNDDETVSSNRKQGGRGKGEDSEDIVVSITATSDAGGLREDDICPTDTKGLSYVLAKIKAAESKVELEQIRDAVKSGVLALHGKDRLEASKAFMVRSKELD